MSERVDGDVDLVQPGLAAIDVGKRVDQRRLAGADRFDLRAGEHHAGLQRLVDVVLMARATVACEDLDLVGAGVSFFGFLAGHGGPLTYTARASATTRTSRAPATRNTPAHSFSVAPVVNTSSTSNTRRPRTRAGSTTAKAPATSCSRAIGPR